MLWKSIYSRLRWSVVSLGILSSYLSQKQQVEPNHFDLVLIWKTKKETLSNNLDINIWLVFDVAIATIFTKNEDKIHTWVSQLVQSLNWSVKAYSCVGEYIAVWPNLSAFQYIYLTIYTEAGPALGRFFSTLSNHAVNTQLDHKCTGTFTSLSFLAQVT